MYASHLKISHYNPDDGACYLPYHIRISIAREQGVSCFVSKTWSLELLQIGQDFIQPCLSGHLFREELPNAILLVGGLFGIPSILIDREQGVQRNQRCYPYNPWKAPHLSYRYHFCFECTSPVTFFDWHRKRGLRHWCCFIGTGKRSKRRLAAVAPSTTRRNGPGSEQCVCFWRASQKTNPGGFVTLSTW